MADNSKIEWTDATWNPITGCSVVSAGCRHCYAMKLDGTRLQHHPSRAGLTAATPAGPVWNGQVRFNEDWLRQPLQWRRGRRIFVCAHGDLFHHGVAEDWLDRVFAIMGLAFVLDRGHKFQVLTKRADRMRDYLSDPDTIYRVMRMMKILGPAGGIAGENCPPTWPLPNVWLGVSVEDQAKADERIPLLLQTPAAVRWISAEPLLGPVRLSRWMDDPCNCGVPAWEGVGQHAPRCKSVTEPWGVDWVVVGGESGPDARPMHPDWARALRDQCAAAGVPFLFKQWGEWASADCIDTKAQFAVWRGRTRLEMLDAGLVREWHPSKPKGQPHFGCNHWLRAGKKAAGRLLDGELHDGYPKERP